MKTLFIIVAVLFVLNVAVRWFSRRARLSGRLPPPGKATDSDIERLVRSGRVLSAIKVYRELHGVGLNEARDAVHRMRDEMRSSED